MSLLTALLLEALFGDPSDRFHPVAWFGRWAAWCEARLHADTARAGLLCWAAALLPWALPILPLRDRAGWPADALLLWISLGWRSLFTHVRAVLDADTLPTARRAAAKIVSRDTGRMGMVDARRAALESLAENASDAVVAPLFWFVLAGGSGAWLYRLVNTLDAMWGYRNGRYRRFGRWAARVDDAVNWLPARLTAWLMLLPGRLSRWPLVRAQAATHPSPNAGWPEAALACAADLRLGGPVWRGGDVEERPWYGGRRAREPQGAAAAEGICVVRRSLGFAALLALGGSLVVR
ncbi:MAG: cobalamin biosynthesis protein CobD [Zetaproteobacteria bacterium]|nr:MAG: cobalamin biosynthesis protein CobD [Zetaproteobacteria bacterium]